MGFFNKKNEKYAPKYSPNIYGKNMSEAQRRNLAKLSNMIRNTSISDLQSLDGGALNHLNGVMPFAGGGVLQTEVAPMENFTFVKNPIEMNMPTDYPTPVANPETNNNFNPLTKPMTSLIQVNNSFRAPAAAAVFDLNITRSSANIAANLPLPIFGVLDRESDYIEVIAQNLPVGCVLTSITTSSTGKGLTFTYTSGLNVDTITIECPQVPYKNLLRASQGSILKMEQNKLIIDDVTLQSQFSQAIEIVNNSLFGKNENDSFTPNQYKSDLQNQNDIRVLTNTIEVSQEKCIMFNMIPDTIQITLTSFISKYETSRGFNS